MAELLPKDLMFEILMRLPAMSLLRFRCVCKEWRDLIDRPNFAKLHLNYLANRPPSLLIIGRHPQYNNYNAYDVVELSWFCNGSPLDYKELPVPAGGESAFCVGQCNGLVCISDCFGALVWNPATRKQFAFLPPRPPLQGIWFRNWGIGYDKDSDDYKVAAMAEVEGRYLVWFYSLRSRSWKRIDDFPDLIVGFKQLGVFVNGALHWAVRQQVFYTAIVALDLLKLEYNLVPTPYYDDPQNFFKCFEYLGVLDGRLCAIYRDSNSIGFDLWIMKEYGVKESWTKLIRCAPYICHLIPLTYLEDGEALLFTLYPYYNEIFRFEFKTRSFEKLVDRYCNLISHVYVPSLICPESGN